MFVDWGILGIDPAATAALYAATHAAGSWVTSGLDSGKPADHAGGEISQLYAVNNNNKEISVLGEPTAA